MHISKNVYGMGAVEELVIVDILELWEGYIEADMAR